jgi:hypothetical protein
MATIVPTVGRMVLFHPASNSTKSGFEPTAICAAVVAKVLPDGKLNLGVFDGQGAVHSVTEVPLIQDGDKAPANGHYAEWAQYQKDITSGQIPAVQNAPVVTVTAPAPPAPAK